MSERVTNEQATTEAICQGKKWIVCPSKCPMYGFDDCKSKRAERHEYAADLLDARKERDELRNRLSALEDIATAVEADIDAGRPLEYNVEELRAELIRARKALGILPEQEQTTTLGMEVERK